MTSQTDQNTMEHIFVVRIGIDKRSQSQNKTEEPCKTAIIRVSITPGLFEGYSRSHHFLFKQKLWVYFEACDNSNVYVIHMRPRTVAVLMYLRLILLYLQRKLKMAWYKEVKEVNSKHVTLVIFSTNSQC